MSKDAYRMVKVLIKYGADIYATSRVSSFILLIDAMLARLMSLQRGETPLHYAAKYARESVIRLLLDHYAKNAVSLCCRTTTFSSYLIRTCRVHMRLQC